MNVVASKVVDLEEYRKRRTASVARLTAETPAFAGAIGPVVWVPVMFIPVWISPAAHGQAV